MSDDISFNGRSKEVYERICNVENKTENNRDDMRAVKEDLKEIKDAIIPLSKRVDRHDRIVKNASKFFVILGKFTLIVVSAGAVVGFSVWAGA